MKIEEAMNFLIFNNYPKKGPGRDSENRRIRGLIKRSIENKTLTAIKKDDVDIVEFCRWASNKKNTKHSTIFSFPWLESCLNLPPEKPKPITAKGVLIRIENNVVPVDIESCQKHLVTAWQKISALQKENNELLNEVIKLRDKKRKQSRQGTISQTIRRGK